MDYSKYFPMTCVQSAVVYQGRNETVLPSIAMFKALFYFLTFISSYVMQVECCRVAKMNSHKYL